jgi:NADH-quinone oxidoreductase subunit L
MVTAGVYLVCRLSPIYAASPEASAVVAWVGAATALLAATIALVQTDIKKVLAYSTVSQLGYMFLAAGCGGFDAAMAHLGTHAFFKALLFLSAGAVILALHHEQDIEKMGGLRRRLFWVWAVFLIGVLAISGAPGFSGFFSKDEILVAAWVSHLPGHVWLYRIAVATAGLTAFYMFRLLFKVFEGECRLPPEVRDHIEEPPATVMNPLYVLAFFSVVAGYVALPQVWGNLLGIPDSNSLDHFLAPALVEDAPHAIERGAELALAATAVAVAGLGALAAWYLYVRRPELPARLTRALRAPYALLRNKYWVDELYDLLFVRPTVFLSEKVLFRAVDATLIDGIAVNGTARGVRSLADGALKYLHSGLTQSYVFVMLIGAVVLVGWLVR